MRSKFRLKNLTVVITLIVELLGPLALAGNQSRLPATSIRSQAAKVLFSSLGGAFIGMSTLSFYSKPQDHLNNVAVGGAVGALLGAAYVTQEAFDFAESPSFDEGGALQIMTNPDRRDLGFLWSFSY